jgi:hypothetical protein
LSGRGCAVAENASIHQGGKLHLAAVWKQYSSEEVAKTPGVTMVSDGRALGSFGLLADLQPAKTLTPFNFGLQVMSPFRTDYSGCSHNRATAYRSSACGTGLDQAQGALEKSCCP